MAGTRRACQTLPLAAGLACALLIAGMPAHAQQDPAARLFLPASDGSPQHFRKAKPGRAPVFGVAGNRFDSSNVTVKRRERENRARRKAAEESHAQPLAAPTPDLTVSPLFQPVPSTLSRTRALSRAAAAPDVTGATARPLRRSYPEADPFGPAGIRAGAFVLRPAIELRTGYDSNPGRVPQAAGSAFQQVAPELQVRSDWSRHAFDADLKGSYIWYNTLENFNRPELDLNARARIDITSLTRAELEGRYRFGTDSPSNPNLPTGIAKPPRYDKSYAGAALAHRFNRLEVTARGSFDRTAYDEAELNDGSRIDLKDRNYDQYSGLLRAGYELYPGVTPFVEGGIDRRVHDLAQDFSGLRRDSDGRLIRAGSTFALTGFLTGEAAIGYVQRDYEDPALGQVHGMIYDASLIYHASPLTTLKLNAQSRIDETIIPGVSGAFVREAGLQIDHSFRRWLFGTLKFSIGRDDYEGFGRVDDRYLASAALTYKITRELHLKGEFRREWLRSNVPGVDYTANIAMIGLRLQR